MMTEFKFSSKFRIFAIISAALIVLGLTLGTIFHFTLGGFFNYSGEYASYKAVTVTAYEIELGGRGNDVEGVESDIPETDVEKICGDVFKAVGVGGYTAHYDTVNPDASSRSIAKIIEYRFPASADGDKLKEAAEEINSAFDALITVTDIRQSKADFSESNALLGGGFSITRAAIVLAVIVAAHAIYTLIRYKLSAACTAFAIDLHNIALYIALLALLRIPVSSVAAIYAIIVALLSVFGSILTLDRIRVTKKEDESAKLSSADVADIAARQTFKSNIASSALFAVLAVIAAVLITISALNISALLSPVLCALEGAAVCVYGNAFVLPSVYPPIAELSKKIFSKPSKKQGK